MATKSLKLSAVCLLSSLALLLTVLSAAAALTFTNRTTANGLGSDGVNDVFVDGSTVYAATDGGLSISTNGGMTFTNRTTADGLGSNFVRSVFASGSTVYAATEGGLSISTNGGMTFTNRTTADGLGNNILHGVFASGSTVYAATEGGLSISTNGGVSFTNRTTADGLADNLLFDVFVDGSTLYVATNNGLSISTNGGMTFTNRTTADGLGHRYLRGVFADGLNVYVATEVGLSISTNGGVSFTNRTTANGLGSSAVRDAFANGSAVYAATTGGLAISTDGGVSFTNNTTANGLGSNFVGGVFVDGSTMYAATMGGLAIATLPPEMTVLGNGQAIADGDTSPAAADLTDFGNLFLGQVLTHTFTISNTGLADLTLTGSPLVSITGPAAMDFSLVVSPTSSLQPGASTTFQVRFSPSIAGTRAVTLTLANNDSDENPYNFSIQGNGVIAAAPEIEVSGLGIVIADGDTTPALADDTNFGAAIVGFASITHTFTIINNGNAALTLGSVSLAGATDFSVVSQPSSPVAINGGSTTFAIKFSPTLAGVQTATVTLTNDDGDEHPYNFTLQGTGQSPTKNYLPLMLK